MRRRASRAMAALLLAIAAGAVAHHSQAMFVETPVWVTGTIVRYRPVDPHAMIELREAQPGGPGRRWIVEGPRRGRLEQILAINKVRDDQILKVGDSISVCGFPLRKDWDPNRMYADWPPEQGRFVHGQVFVVCRTNSPYNILQLEFTGIETSDWSEERFRSKKGRFINHKS